MLVTPHMTYRYVDVKKYCDGNDIDNTANEQSLK